MITAALAAAVLAAPAAAAGGEAAAAGAEAAWAQAPEGAPAGPRRDAVPVTCRPDLYHYRSGSFRLAFSDGKAEATLIADIVPSDDILALAKELGVDWSPEVKAVWPAGACRQDAADARSLTCAGQARLILSEGAPPRREITTPVLLTLERPSGQARWDVRLTIERGGRFYVQAQGFRDALCAAAR
jgi:hypothetical protein